MKRIYIAASLLALFSGNVMPNECLGCHKIGDKDIGLAFRDISRWHSKDKQPLEKLTDTIYSRTFNGYQPQGIDMMTFAAVATGAAFFHPDTKGSNSIKNGSSCYLKGFIFSTRDIWKA